jgi:hypothetical protein
MKNHQIVTKVKQIFVSDAEDVWKRLAFKTTMTVEVGKT